MDKKASTSANVSFAIIPFVVVLALCILGHIYISPLLQRSPSSVLYIITTAWVLIAILHIVYYKLAWSQNKLIRQSQIDESICGNNGLEGGSTRYNVMKHDGENVSTMAGLVCLGFTNAFLAILLYLIFMGGESVSQNRGNIIVLISLGIFANVVLPLLFNTLGMSWYSTSEESQYRQYYNNALKMWEAVKVSYTANGHNPPLPLPLYQLERNVLRRIMSDKPGLTNQTAMNAVYMEMTPEETFQYINFTEDADILLPLFAPSDVLVCPDNVNASIFANLDEAKVQCTELNASSELHTFFQENLDIYAAMERAITALRDKDFVNPTSSIDRKLRKINVYMVTVLVTLGYLAFHYMYKQYYIEDTTSKRYMYFVLTFLLLVITLIYYGSSVAEYTSI